MTFNHHQSISIKVTFITVIAPFFWKLIYAHYVCFFQGCLILNCENQDNISHDASELTEVLD